MIDATTPTKDGFYLWRESAFNRWTIVSVYSSVGMRRVARILNRTRGELGPLNDIGRSYPPSPLGAATSRKSAS